MIDCHCDIMTGSGSAESLNDKFCATNPLHNKLDDTLQGSKVTFSQPAACFCAIEDPWVGCSSGALSAR